MAENEAQERALQRADNLIDALADPAMAMMIGLAGNPYIGVAWLASIGIFKYVRTAQTDKFDSFVNVLKEGNFNPRDVETAGFCEGLQVMFEAYMKARNEIKLNVIRRIILGFSSTVDRHRFQLERLCNDTNSISPEALHFLLFLKTNAVPQMKATFEKTWSDENPQESEKWYKYEPIDPVIGTELQKYDPNNKGAQERYGLDPSKNTPDGGPPENNEISLRMWRDQRYKQAEFDDATAELLGMGILRTQSDALGYQDNTVNFITEYGVEFMNYLFEEDLRIS